MKPMTLDEIKAALDSGNVPFSDGEVIRSGLMQRDDGTDVQYQIHVGWDLVKARCCDKQWGVFNLDLLTFIKKQNYDDSERSKILASIQMDDSHWRWFDKSRVFTSSEYVWLYLMAEDAPQGACLIYHPKASAFASGDIFYIEYIAAAPWNRVNPMLPRKFKGVGGLLIKAAIQYASNWLKLRQGFSLHAIPRAVPFYERLGMLPHEAFDKDVLKYFEMPETKAIEYGAAKS